MLQAGLTLDTSHFGVTYAPGGTSDGWDHVLAVRLSSDSTARWACPRAW